MYKGATPVEGAWTPQGATPVERRATPRYTPPTQEEIDAVNPSNDMNFAEKFLVGAGAATDKAARGIASLFPKSLGLDTAAGKEDAALYKRHHPGGWADTGEVAAELAMSAIPVAKGAQLASRAGLGAVGADVAANAAWSAATAGPEQRLSAALMGGGGAGGAHALTKTLRGATPGPQAQKLLDAGIMPTHAQVMREQHPRLGATLRGLEMAAEQVPLAGQLMRNRSIQQQEQFRNAINAGAGRAKFGSGNFTPADVLARSRMPRRRELAEAAEAIIGSGDPTRSASPAASLAATMAGLHSPLPTALAAAGAAVHGSPGVQKALIGQLPIQQKIEQYLIQHPELSGAAKQQLVQLMRALSEPEENTYAP